LNDVSEIFVHCQHLIYADDLKIFMKISSLEDVKRLQSDLHRLSDWCRDSGLMLNVKKCKVMSFTRRKSLIQEACRIDNVVLERVSSICDLGVTLDESLSFGRHIDSVISRANGKLGFIRCI
jgi:ribonucleases P/MRP protein subunit RPP40